MIQKPPPLPANPTLDLPTSLLKSTFILLAVLPLSLLAAVKSPDGKLEADFTLNADGAPRTAKLLARDRKGGLVFGYAALPDEPAEYPLLSTHGSIKASAIENGTRELIVQVENFGLAKSAATQVKLQLRPNGREPVTVNSPLPALAPYASADVIFRVPTDLTPAGSNPPVEIVIDDHQEANPLKVSLAQLP